ncbi:hypothetical protein D3C71_1506180 [compost metagenome]
MTIWSASSPTTGMNRRAMLISIANLGTGTPRRLSGFSSFSNPEASLIGDVVAVSRLALNSRITRRKEVSSPRTSPSSVTVRPNAENIGRPSVSTACNTIDRSSIIHRPRRPRRIFPSGTFARRKPNASKAAAPATSAAPGRSRTINVSARQPKIFVRGSKR